MSFILLADEHRIELSLFPENEEITAWIDLDQMEKVMFNLLSNAFKFTPDGGAVRVFLNENKTAETIEIKVADTGPGIRGRQRRHPGLPPRKPRRRI